MPPRADRSVSAGFSLIELLVAMAVFALVVLALLNLAGESTRTAALIEERVFAEIVADNVAAETMLLPPDALVAPAHGTEILGGLGWNWSREASAPAGGEGMLRVDILVRQPHDGRIVSEASLFRSVQ